MVSLVYMNIDLTSIATQMVGMKVPKPVSGTLSGHAAGEPFDKLVYALIKKQQPHNTYRQYEYLNELYGKNATTLTYDERRTLIASPTLQFLLNRGKAVTAGWAADKQFEEKQNDTADILVTSDTSYDIIDVKTVNTGKVAQAPNIISALKLANMCKIMIEQNDFNAHNIFYFEVKWKIDGDFLVCTACTFKDLFKAKPESLYINWAAALQVQFHVSQLGQDFTGSKADWCHTYLRTFTAQAQRRIATMQTNFVDAFTLQGE